MLRRRSRKMKQKKRLGSEKEIQKQVKTNYFANLFEKTRNKKKEKTQRNIFSLLRTNKQETNFSHPKKRTEKKETIQKKTLFFCEEGRVCKRRK